MFTFKELDAYTDDELESFLRSENRLPGKTHGSSVLRAAKLLVINSGFDYEDSLLINYPKFVDTLVLTDDILVQSLNTRYKGHVKPSEITRIGCVYLLSEIWSDRTRPLIAVTHYLEAKFNERQDEDTTISSIGLSKVGRSYRRNEGSATPMMLALRDACMTERAHSIYPMVQFISSVVKNVLNADLPQGMKSTLYIKTFPDRLDTVRDGVIAINNLFISNGLYHNNLTPENVLVDDGGYLWIKDFSQASFEPLDGHQEKFDNAWLSTAIERSISPPRPTQQRTSTGVPEALSLRISRGSDSPR